MAQTAQTLTDVLLRRMRDPDGIAHSAGFGLTRAHVRDLLTDAQRAINANTRFVLQTSTLTTLAFKHFYKLSTELSTATRIIGVRSGNRDLRRAPWTTLAHLNPGWFRATDDDFEIYSLIGRDLLCLWPAKDHSSTVTVVNAKLTTAFTAESTNTELADQDLEPLLDLAEAMARLTNRRLDGFDEALARLRTRLGLRRTIELNEEIRT